MPTEPKVATVPKSESQNNSSSERLMKKPKISQRFHPEMMMKKKK